MMRIDAQSARRMKRHEFWRMRYREARDLDHLSSDELSERVHDCVNNMRTLTEKGQMGVSPVNEAEGEKWWVRFTEIMEECELRGFGFPGPINISQYKSSLDGAFDPIPNIGPALKSLAGRPYILKALRGFEWVISEHHSASDACGY